MRSNFKANFCHTVSFIALTLPMLAILSCVHPAYAAAGAGGDSGSSSGDGHLGDVGGAGATGSTGNAGTAGSGAQFAGGGGGGGGAGGGNGGDGGNAQNVNTVDAGGAGGTSINPNGADGGNDIGSFADQGKSNGGGGGGGGYNGNGAGAATVTNAALSSLIGGNGGNGGSAYSSANATETGGGGGGGGAGGYGAVITGSGSSTNSGTITGGNAGNGGNGASIGVGGIEDYLTLGAPFGGNGNGGNGGDGGVGVQLSSGSTFTNSGTITGGNGGTGGTGGHVVGHPSIADGTSGANGVGGAGIVGSGITIINNLGGSISGGFGGDSITQANAITFTGGSNTLTLGGGTFTGNIDVTGSVTFNQSTARTLFNNITGSGSVIDNGTGNLTLSGTNTYTGGTSVLAGTLEVGDASHTSASIFGAVNVSNGAVLMGHGHVTGTVVNNGTTSPGGSIGTLTVGNYTQNSGGVLSIEVSPTASSQLVVTGAASLAGQLHILFDSGAYTPHTYTILTANSISGTLTPFYGSIATTNGLLLEAHAPVYSANAITFSVFAPSPAGVEVVGSATTSGINSSNLASNAVFDHMDEARNGTSNSNPNPSFAFTNVVDQNASSPSNVFALNNLAKALPDVMKQNGGWFKATGNLASISSTNGVSGFSSQSGGFLAGFDTVVDDGMTVGVAGGYEHTTSAVNNASNTGADINTVRLVAYGGQKFDHGYALDAHAGYALHMIDTTRYDSTTSVVANGSHDAHELSFGLQGSQTIAAGDNFWVTPKIGMNYTYLYEDGYTETGAGVFDVTAKGQGTNSLRLYTGASVDKTFDDVFGMSMTPEARLKYSYEAGDAVSVTSASYGGRILNASGVRPSPNTLTAGAGVTAKLDADMDGFANYDVDLPLGNTFVHSFEVGVRARF